MYKKIKLITMVFIATLLFIGTSTVFGAVQKPTAWNDVQGIVDGMSNGDTLDLSALSKGLEPTTPGTTINITKNISVIDIENGTIPFKRLFFVVSENSTVTFKNIMIYSDTATKSIISGTGNLIIDSSRLMYVNYATTNPPSTINVNGNVTIKGFIYKVSEGVFNYTTQIVGASTNTITNTPEVAISAVNIIVEGGAITGGSNYAGGTGGNSIKATGNVSVSGSLFYIADDNDYWVTSVIQGGTGSNGGKAIVVNGNTTIDGGQVLGGAGTDIGGTAITTAGNLNITGELVDTYWSSAIRGGKGTTESGVAIKFTGDDNSNTRYLIIDTALVCRLGGGNLSDTTILMQKNDIGVFTKSRIGFSADDLVPLIKGGEYIFINPERTKGTLALSIPYEMTIPTVNETPTNTTITLNTISWAEYSIDNGNTWQDSNTFTELTQNTEYNFIARNKTLLINSISNIIKTSNKSTPIAPIAPTINGIATNTTITLNTIIGAEYSKDNGENWQDSSTFEGLTPNTDYTFISRIKATSNSYASANSQLSDIIRTKALPTVTSITVTPTSVQMKKGETQIFISTVIGMNSPSQTVIWMVEGNNSLNTFISGSGVLTVGADETATSLTVRATSTVDNTKSGTTIVTLINSNDNNTTDKKDNNLDNEPKMNEANYVVFASIISLISLGILGSIYGKERKEIC